MQHLHLEIRGTFKLMPRDLVRTELLEAEMQPDTLRHKRGKSGRTIWERKLTADEKATASSGKDTLPDNSLRFVLQNCCLQIGVHFF